MLIYLVEDVGYTPCGIIICMLPLLPSLANIVQKVGHVKTQGFEIGNVLTKYTSYLLGQVCVVLHASCKTLLIPVLLLKGVHMIPFYVWTLLFLWILQAPPQDFKSILTFVLG